MMLRTQTRYKEKARDCRTSHIGNWAGSLEPMSSRSVWAAWEGSVSRRELRSRVTH